MPTVFEVEKIWLTDDAVWIQTKDGREACEYFAEYPRLKYASPKQRANFKADDFGINWPDIDEDLSFEGMFAQAGLCTRTETEDTIYWEA